MTKTTTPWTKIKAEYLQGATPAELAKKYSLTSQQIRSKASKEKWTAEKLTISNKVTQHAEDKIKEYTNDAIETLHEVMKDYEAKNADRVSAARAILDISGLKCSKQQITGAHGEALIVQKEYILPEEIKEFEKHYKKAVEG